MTAVLGLDVSTRRTGAALPTGRAVSLSPSTTDVARRLHWFAGALARLLRCYEPEIAVIEGYAPNSVGILSTIRLAELGGVIRLTLHEHSVPYVEIGPGQLKRWATGNGNATDEAMIAAATAAGGTPANDDEADALLARAVAVHALDSVDLLDGQPHADIRLQVVSAITWPGGSR